ncbi:LamG-like jellyroll fold domain-containing protein [Roseibacillus persicicus]|uniref:LamG-like jellyroll fold domain-containing protein n=1 Tax=Roseibacillus persicicus TaxID=454148 RepID=UPI00280EC115|nr:LamG-like jellyroll fold domain-containing protein [Roseibacillus persicicus]MDQ8190632.1 FecR domain-containing protein [Roseibacillus persicicus]
MKKSLDELTAAYFSGTLKEDEFDKLKSMLREDRGCLKRFCDEAEFENELREVAVTIPFPAQLQRKPFWSRKAVWAAAAALVFLLSAIALFSFQSAQPKILADYSVSPHGRILVSGPEEGKRINGQLEAGATIRVAQGSARIDFREGVRCLLDAPAELTLQREGVVVLKGGRARFDVEDKARGFQVVSGDLQLTDLGTSFGVDATSQSPEVHVLSGLVVGQGRSGKREETRVEGGQAMVLADEGKMVPIPINEERFPFDLGKGIPALRLSFEGGNDRHCSGSIAKRDGVQLLLNSEYAPRLVPGRFGQALEFDGGETHARTNWPGVNGSQARSVSFWLKTNESKRPNPILGWGLRSGNDRMSFFGVRLSVPGCLRLVSGRRWLEGSTVLDDGAWHHVVLVSGDYKKGAWPVTRLYIDGKLESLTPRVPMDGRVASLDTFDTVTTDPGSDPLMIGRFIRAEENTAWDLASFSGVIDEVIVAEGLIDEEGVQALYEGRLEDSGLDLSQ